MLAVLILATIGDLAIAVLLVALSGFIFGYHEGLHGEPTAVAMWSASLAACIAAPIAGFVLHAKRLPMTGVLIAFVPIIAGLLLLAS